MKQRTCKYCGSLFTPFKPLQPKVCTSIDCRAQFAIDFVDKLKKKREAENRKETREKKQQLKTWQEWFDECKTLAQKYARLRDKYDGCISCNKPASWGGQWHGSHFRPAGNNKAVALNLLNIHKACSECNNHKSGNLIDYQDKLIKKIGQAKVDWLKAQTQPYKHSIEYLQRYKKVMTKMCRRIERISEYRGKIKELEKQDG